MLEGNTKGAILVVTYERWHTTTYIGVSGKFFYATIKKMVLLTISNFWTEALPNWVMALAAAWGVYEIIRGHYKLRRQQNENEQKINYLNDQLNELRKQTTQFEYQTKLMNENNGILERGIENLTGILGQGQEAEEQRLEIDRQRRIIEIRPFFVFAGGSSNPGHFSIRLRNQGGTATNFRVLDQSNETLSTLPLNAERIVQRGQELEVVGRPAPGQNANLLSGHILLGFVDEDENQYQQNIIRNSGSVQIGLPTLVEN